LFVLLVEKRAGYMTEKPEDAIIQTTIGHRLRQAREAKQWSQRELAKRLSKSQSSITEIEQGVRGLTSADIVHFCRVLNVSVQYLFYDLIPEQLTSEENAFQEQVLLEIESLPDKEVRQRVVDIIRQVVRLAHNG
jgi:transcriptional regulator with XRE-family HTH domain